MSKRISSLLLVLMLLCLSGSALAESTVYPIPEAEGVTLTFARLRKPRSPPNMILCKTRRSCRPI